MLAVSVGVADVRRNPDGASELVTQALMGTPVVPGPSEAGWQWVHLADYEGWVQIEHLAPTLAPSSSGQVAVVTALSTALLKRAVGRAARDGMMLNLSTVLPLVSSPDDAGLVKVALPGGECGWLRAADVVIRPAEQAFPREGAGAAIATAIAVARRLVGSPYLWGGTTCKGIDCSGLVQLCFRMAGYALPRDARQQIAAFGTEPAGVPAPGDLLFFAKDGRIVHVALSLGQWEVVHAEGVKQQRVVQQSMNPAHADRYNQRLVELYCGARRVVATDAEETSSHSLQANSTG